jgi:hypothetical protein
MTLSGVSSLQWTWTSVLMRQSKFGGLTTKFTLDGHPSLTIGVFRTTGHETNCFF